MTTQGSIASPVAFLYVWKRMPVRAVALDRKAKLGNAEVKRIAEKAKVRNCTNTLGHKSAAKETLYARCAFPGRNCAASTRARLLATHEFRSGNVLASAHRTGQNAKSEHRSMGTEGRAIPDFSQARANGQPMAAHCTVECSCGCGGSLPAHLLAVGARGTPVRTVPLITGGARHKGGSADLTASLCRAVKSLGSFATLASPRTKPSRGAVGLDGKVRSAYFTHALNHSSDAIRAAAWPTHTGRLTRCARRVNRVFGGRNG
jgi:hypothetical protein